MTEAKKTITIERLGHRGDGIGRGPVFVQRALPGEIVAGVVEHGRMTAAKIITPVLDRVRPPCQHYKTCGGCSLQHASDEFVAEWKKSIVKTALNGQGLPAPIRHMAISPPRSRRRATIAARRLKKSAQAGFYGLRSDTISEIYNCHLLRPELLDMLPLVHDLVRAGGSRKTRLAVTLTLLDGGIDVAVMGGKPLTPTMFSTIAEIAGKAGGVARLSWEGEPVVTFIPPTLTLGHVQISPPPGAFLQATCEGERALTDAVLEAASASRHVVDLFSGCGTFTLPLAKKYPVHATEGSSDMLVALNNGWRKVPGLKAVTTEARDLFRRPLLPDELSKFDTAVIDPPRAGAEAQIAEIAKSSLEKVVMVSCNPVTFARDTKVLVQAGFSIRWIDIIDQFRWSPHVEIVASLVRSG